MRFFASAPRGFTDLLRLELLALGAADAREQGARVVFEGPLELAYRACLELRTASRVYLELSTFLAADDAALYAALRAIDWTTHLSPGVTLACEFSGRHPRIVNTHFGTLRVKDAICDALRDATGSRPDIETGQPGVSVHVHASGERMALALDLAGESLHKRGWRADSGPAPLRENVAAGILLRAGWLARAERGAALLDPLCGSGTIVIEAAQIAADVAPGLGRRYYGFLGWVGHDPEAWAAVQREAQAKAALGRQRAAGRAAEAGGALLIGRDRDMRAIAIARDNAATAGVADLVRFEVGDLVDARPPAGAAAGLVCTNPPYGVRLGDIDQARATHVALGLVLREHFAGWSAAVLAGSGELGLELGLRAERTHAVWNGAIEGRLLRIEVGAAATRDLRPRDALELRESLRDTPGARMFGNRLRKNLRHLEAWAKRESVSCLRIYDADMPEYAFAVDLYRGVESDQRWACVQEYAAPREIPEQDVRRRRGEALAALGDVLNMPADNLHLRTRRRQARGEQYLKLDREAQFHVVDEYGLRFLVNFTDYLDTGLFLDHRLTRLRLRGLAHDRDFLNLFGYTGTATVHAAAGGARTTTTVDLSNTYLDWAYRNLGINGFEGPRHRLLREDAREWLARAAQDPQRYGLIFLDPPTFSNSARMSGVLDVQRDHAQLIAQAMALLVPDGLLVFSTNAQKFTLGPALRQQFQVADISRATLPLDFARNPRIHCCFEIRHMAAPA